MNINENRINNLISNFEKNTGSELSIVISKKSDPYPAASLRGAIICSLLLSLVLSFSFHLTLELHLLIYLIGLILINKMISFLSFESFFISKKEVDRETLEKAKEMFLDVCLLKTKHQLNSFIHISLMERKIHLLVDQRINEKVHQNELNAIVEKFTLHLKEMNMTQTLEATIIELQTLIQSKFDGNTSDQSPLVLENKLLFID